MEGYSLLRSPFSHPAPFPASPTLPCATAAKQDSVLYAAGGGEVPAGERELMDFTVFTDVRG